MDIPNDLLAQLPPLLSQEAEVDPFIYARFLLPGTNKAWYIAEGSEHDGDLIFFGLVCDEDVIFKNFRLSQLMKLRSPAGDCIALDASFTPGKLTEVVPAPDL